MTPQISMAFSCPVSQKSMATLEKGYSGMGKEWQLSGCSSRRGLHVLHTTDDPNTAELFLRRPASVCPEMYLRWNISRVFCSPG